MFYEDRYECKSRLIKLLGLEDHVKNPIEVDQCFSSDTELSLESNKDEFIKKLFKINIPFNVFTLIKPTTVTYKDKKSGYRSYDILPPGIWTDTINDILLKEHKLPCNFIYKRIKVSRDSRNSEHYIWFCAKCKDCGSEMEGWSDTEPKGGESLILSLRTNDTRGTETMHDTKRPLKGFKRKMVGEQLSSDFRSNWRRKNISDLEFGCTSPPNLYTLNTLSKAKQQFKDVSLGIVEKYPIKYLVEFKHNSTYAGSIYNIGMDPFFVYYWSNHQIII